MENLSPIKDVSRKEAEAFKLCCADFYQQAAVKFFLSDSFHPGGLGLTRQIAEKLGISSKNYVLDMACGEGSSAIFLAEMFHCKVFGTDASEKGIQIAQNKLASLTKFNAEQIKFLVADSEQLPLDKETFDFVLTECAFSTFVDKEKTTAEIYRVLKPGGCWALSDMLVEQDQLPSTMKNLLFQSACIAMAENLTGYAHYMQKLSLTITATEDTSWALDTVIQDVEKRFMAAKLLKNISDLSIKMEDLNAVKKLLEQAKDLLNKKIIGYGFLIGKKC